VTLARKDGLILLRDAATAPAPVPPAAPSVAFVGVQAGQTVRGTVSWEAEPSAAASQVVFSIDGAAAWTERLAPWQFNADGRFDTTKLADGTHTLGLAVTLADGRSAQASIQVVVQNAGAPPPATTPSVAFVGVQAGQTLRGTVVWEAAPSAPTSQVVFSIDGGVAWTERLAPWQFDADGRLDTTKLADGDHTLGLNVTFADGRSAQASIHVVVQNGSAAPSVAFVGVQAGQTLRGTVVWEADPSAPASQVVFSIDGGVAWTERLGPWQYNADGRFDTTKLADGAHTLGLAVTYADGRSAQASIPVVVRNQ
jgi:Flp pilus assembly protein TadG